MEPPVVAGFVEWAPEDLEGVFRIASGRNNAFYGFDTPELRLLLPMVGNSTYAQISMPEPRLLDGDGEEVAFELERGLHDPATQIAEIRFLDDSGESPAVFSRAVGSLTVKFPVEIVSQVVERNHQGKDTAVQCLIDGRFVDVTEVALPEAAPFSVLEPVRAFDAAGRQLQRDPATTTYVEGRDDLKRFGFHGEIHRVEVDTISKWVEVTIDYDVPIATPLAAASKGDVDEDPRAVRTDPRSVVEVTVSAAD